MIPRIKLYPLSGSTVLILLFAVIKLSVHLLTFSNYELHRDAYLYYALGEHLDWGFASAPPTLALLARLMTSIFGNTVFALRIVPALAGAISISLVGLICRELGGRIMAISLACLAYLFGPVYLHVNTLFQPVALNHMYWLISSYLFVLLIRKQDPRIWIYIGLVFGLAFLNKYSIVFLYLAFGLSLLISMHRKLYLSWHLLIAMAIGLVIILPNILWQISNSWPLMHHMSELRETQLVHVKSSDFLTDQLLMNMQAVLIWIPAILILIFKREEKSFRLFGFSFLILIILLIFTSGKSYYSLGIYPLYFAFGAYFIEKYVKKFLYPVNMFLTAFIVVSLIVSFRFSGIPFLGPDKVARENGFRWEDGQYYEIPQDMADMTGWNDLSRQVIDLYQGLDPEIRENCDIFCEHYGQAGAIMFHGKKEGIPEPFSDNDSFLFWAPDSLSKDYMIRVHFYAQKYADLDSMLDSRFEKASLMGIVSNPWFRENGTRIYLCSHPKGDFKKRYKEYIREEKSQYRRN